MFDEKIPALNGMTPQYEFVPARYSTTQIYEYKLYGLTKIMIFIGGSRQIGKTTLALTAIGAKGFSEFSSSSCDALPSPSLPFVFQSSTRQKKPSRFCRLSRHILIEIAGSAGGLNLCKENGCL